MITQELLKELLDYSQDTGMFVWKINRGKRFCAGRTAGSLTGKGYRRIKIYGDRYQAHRLAWLYVFGKFPDNYIDHINGIRNDNRINNLRDVSIKTNLQNQRKPQVDSKSGYLGVSWDKRAKKWKARIMINDEQKYLGLFATAEEAHAGYLSAKRHYHEGCTI
jgi:hypothetical protein